MKKNNISEPSLTFCRNKILQLLAWKISLGDWTREFLYDDDITTFCLHWKLNSGTGETMETRRVGAEEMKRGRSPGKGDSRMEPNIRDIQNVKTLF